jgi:hypothetical protein
MYAYRLDDRRPEDVEMPLEELVEVEAGSVTVCKVLVGVNVPAPCMRFWYPA